MPNLTESWIRSRAMRPLVKHAVARYRRDSEGQSPGRRASSKIRYREELMIDDILNHVFLDRK